MRTQRPPESTRGRGGPGPETGSAAASAARRHVLIFCGLLLVTFVVGSTQLPWRMLAAATGIATIVSGLVTLRACRRARVRGLTVVAIVVGIGLTALTVVATVAVAFIWDIETDRQECYDRAITSTARAECRQAYERSLQERLTSWQERAGG